MGVGVGVGLGVGLGLGLGVGVGVGVGVGLGLDLGLRAVSGAKGAPRVLMGSSGGDDARCGQQWR